MKKNYDELVRQLREVRDDRNNRFEYKWNWFYHSEVKDKLGIAPATLTAMVNQGYLISYTYFGEKCKRYEFADEYEERLIKAEEKRKADEIEYAKKYIKENKYQELIDQEEETYRNNLEVLETAHKRTLEMIKNKYEVYLALVGNLSTED